jgi:hypothetical protein
MKKITFLLLVMFLVINYSYCQIDIKPKSAENQNILITSDIMVGFPHLVKFSFDYYQNLFAYGVSAGFAAGDVHIGLRPVTFKNGQLSILAVYGISPVGQDNHTDGSAYYGGYVDLILIKHLKINLGIVNFSNTSTSLQPYVNIGYCFNLFKK